MGTEAAVVGAGVVATGAGVAIESGAGDEATSITTDVIAVMGRFPDYLAPQGQPGYEVFSMPPSEWTEAKNDAWVQSVIDRALKVFVASPDTPDNLVKPNGEATQFAKELEQFLAAGYTKVGDYLIPPGGTP